MLARELVKPIAQVAKDLAVRSGPGTRERNLESCRGVFRSGERPPVTMFRSLNRSAIVDPGGLSCDEGVVVSVLCLAEVPGQQQDDRRC